MNPTRRGFLGGLLATIAAPAIVHAGVIMPVKTVFMPWGEADFNDALRPDVLRQDNWLRERIANFAVENGLTVAGEPEFSTLHVYRNLSLRRAAVRFMTDDKEFIRVHKAHPTYSSWQYWRGEMELDSI